MRKFIAVAVVTLMMVALASQAFGLVIADAASPKKSPVSITNLVVGDTYLNPFTVKNWSGIVQQNAYAAGSNIWFIAELTVAGWDDTDAPQYWRDNGGDATLKFTSPTNSLNFTPASQATFATISGLNVMTSQVDKNVIYVNTNLAEFSLSSNKWTWGIYEHLGTPAPNTRDTLYFDNGVANLSMLRMDAIYDKGEVRFTRDSNGVPLPNTPAGIVSAKTLPKAYYLHFMAMTNEATEGKCVGTLTVNGGVDTFHIDNSRKYMFHGINNTPNTMGDLVVEINGVAVMLLESGASYGAKDMFDALKIAEGKRTGIVYDLGTDAWITDIAGTPINPHNMTTWLGGVGQYWDNDDTTMLITQNYNDGTEPKLLEGTFVGVFLGMFSMNSKDGKVGKLVASNTSTASATTIYELYLDSAGNPITSSGLGNGRVGSFNLNTKTLYAGERSEMWPLYNTVNGEEYKIFKIPNMAGGPYAGKGVLYVITNKDMDKNIITFVVDGSDYLGLAKFTNQTGFKFGQSDHAGAGISRPPVTGGVSGFDFAMDSVLAYYYLPVASNDISSNVVNLQYLNSSTDVAISRVQLQAIFDFFGLAYVNPVAPADKHFLSRSGFITTAEVSYNVANAIIPTPDTNITIPRTGDGVTGIGIVLAASAILAAAAVGFLLSKRVRG